MTGSFQVFISYARKDNESPADDPSLKGFVSFFHECLIHELTDLGAADIRVWRDTRNIADVDQFEPAIEKEISASSIMLVVMSPNWLASEYCRKEVDRFARRWSEDGTDVVKSRFTVIRKRPNDRALWPSWLQGQSGIAFFSGDQPGDTVLEDGFFWRGKVRDENYYKRVRELAGVLVRHAALGRTQNNPAVNLPARKPPDSGRTIFVARPATDMRAAYDRVVHELARRGYFVVPENDIPVDETAVARIDADLARADFSVHLLGVKAGYAPQEAAPIVQLQLDRAAKRHDELTPDNWPTTGRKVAPKPFRRLIWAPRIVEGDEDSPSGTAGRDPLAVLSGFAERLTTDEIYGEVLSKFIDFLAQTVVANERQISLPPPSGNAPKVYVYHEREDAEFALSVAKALKELHVEPLIPIMGQGAPQDIRAHHRRRLAECDAVALCWATTPEVKLSAKTNELKNWRQLKRSKPFAYRGLILGPPPNQDKKNSEFHFSKDEIDIQVDLSEGDTDLAELVQCLLQLSVKPDVP